MRKASQLVKLMLTYGQAKIQHRNHTKKSLQIPWGPAYGASLEVNVTTSRFLANLQACYKICIYL